MANSPDLGVDLAAYDRSGQVTVLVQIKTKLGASREWAERFRRNIVAHGRLPPARFFLLVLPDRFFLWEGAAEAPEEYDAGPVLRPYFERAGVTLGAISGAGFELLVSSWLSDVLHADRAPDSSDKVPKWLTASGLLDAIKGGYLRHETAA
jgi:hypothetical protein